MNQLTQEEVSRYSRHLMIPQVGLEGQKKLKATSVLIVGAGGLGSPVSLYLAAAGIGRIGLVDNDVVDSSNLQRQILHDTPHAGKPKVISGQERLNALNPYVEVETFCECFNEQTAERIASGYDILVDCTDNFSTRYLINDLCVLTQRPDVYGAIFRFEGQVSVFDARYGPCYRCMFPEPPPPEISPSCAEAGVFGILPGVIGTLQATEVIKLALRIGQPLFGSLLVYDALDASFQKLKLMKQPACRVCGKSRVSKHLVETSQFCKDDSLISLSSYETISPQELAARLSQPNPPLLVDVRNPIEQEVSTIQGSTLIPLDQLIENLDQLDKTREIVVFCRTGKRSARALLLLKRNGFTRVRNLSGGINAWVGQIDSSQFQY